MQIYLKKNLKNFSSKLQPKYSNQRVFTGNIEIDNNLIVRALTQLQATPYISGKNADIIYKGLSAVKTVFLNEDGLYFASRGLINDKLAIEQVHKHLGELAVEISKMSRPA
ncbi:hypothetical protein OMAG_001782 [Candidatus Omnitrophus magneticus]|uniref:Uncharacterized protein n=1 Tax=Candidatus Omnitrophus magneticus TaxID=1609969 RepID=A0A0F0CQN6_9BACT|nr:hypothetical protein OMAG_001782 [Candidatus Omnitrophus magneticus]